MQVDKAQFDNVLSHIESGTEGASLLAGGKAVGNKGVFLELTVFADVQNNMKIAGEEVFGPVMSIIMFKDLDEVVERPNGSVYG